MMDPKEINLLLADDDEDDGLFFEEALKELPLSVNLTTVNNGELLIQYLTSNLSSLPAVLFLDLNMPRKNGFECLVEIKSHEKLKLLPVVIYSTSFSPDTVNLLYSEGAHYYIRKPAEFSKLKKVIFDAITLTLQKPVSPPQKENFILQP